MPRTVVLFIYENFQLLDAAGPIAAFEIASRMEGGAAYDIRVAALEAGLVKSSSGVALPAQALGDIGTIDTLVVAGGGGSDDAMACPSTLAEIAGRSRSTRRLCSVCSGSFILAAAGLLDGLVATTHWRRTADFAQSFPKVRAETDRIFVQQGNIWTSAGVSAGIDLALALIAEDFGAARAKETARQMVVYYRRPGGQSQFSTLLDLGCPSHRFSGLMEEVRARLDEPWSVDRLAERFGMTPRHFSRAFRKATGVSPAKAVARLRVETARARIESGAESIATVAAETGFRDPERMRRAFIDVYGAPPQAVRRASADDRKLQDRGASSTI